jgi:hypothetical protein
VASSWGGQRRRTAAGEQNRSDVTESRVVGRVPFMDGETRDVYEDADGR